MRAAGQISLEFSGYILRRSAATRLGREQPPPRERPAGPPAPISNPRKSREGRVVQRLQVPTLLAVASGDLQLGDEKSEWSFEEVLMYMYTIATMLTQIPL